MAEERQPGTDAVIALGRAVLTQVDFRRARFGRFDLDGCTFIACDFRGLRLDERFQPLFSTRPRSVFRGCRFDGADLRRIVPQGSRFERCSFDDARLDGWRPFLAEFVDCRFAGTLTRVTFAGSPPAQDRKTLDPPRDRNELRGNDFRDAELVDVVFTYGVDLAAQRLPDDERYVRLDGFARRLSGARREIGRWDDPAERAAARAFCEVLAATWREQDEVIALRVSPGAKASPRTQVHVWEALLRAV
jgi:uncharacterized protein YjbI with pentapeptide repeats